MSAEQIITHCMMHAGLSAKELSRKAGVAESTIWSYLSGKSDPSYTKMEKILKACGYRMYVEKKK